MKYTINGCTLDTTTRTLTHGTDPRPIRPKTLAMLLYLIENQDHIISKDTLLAHIWDDVQVNEGVVFQSIREIRQLFNDNHIIQNHPRKGYQFTARVSVDQSPKWMQTVKHYYVHFAALLLVTIGVSVTAYHMKKSNHSVLANTNTLIVLPITSHIAHSDHEWVNLGGMEQLVANLNSMPGDIDISPTTKTLAKLESLGLTAEPVTKQINHLLKTSAAKYVVEADVYGDVYDYKVFYRVHTKNNVVEGVLLDTSIKNAFSALERRIASHVSNVHMSLPPEQEQPLFVAAMRTFGTDWLSAIAQFEHYLKIAPHSSIARRYLTRLYIWNNQLTDASALLNVTLSAPQHQSVERAHGYYHQGVIYSKQHNAQAALHEFNKAAGMLQRGEDWLLLARVEEAKANSYAGLHEMENALSSYDRALAFYEVIQSPVDISAVQLKLAELHLHTNNTHIANTFYTKAKQAISQQKLSFLYNQVAEFEQAHLGRLSQ